MKIQRILNGDNKTFSGGMMKKIHQHPRCGTRIFSLHLGLFVVLISLLLLLFVIQISQAQDAFPKMTKPDSRMERHRTRGQTPYFALTEDQKKALETLHRKYTAESMPTRREILVLRIELRRLFSDPNVEPQILFDHQRKISTLQARLEELTLSYQIKARSSLTKEQLDGLPRDWIIEMIPGHDMMMDVGGRQQRGHP